MSDYQTQKQFRPRRAPKRAAFDRPTVHGILDEGFVAHVAFAGSAGAEVIPTYYVRDGDSVLIHQSTKSGLAMVAGRGIPMSFCVTLIDGLVMARSAFHHSMNYRSVIAHGRFEPVEGAAKRQTLDLFIARVRGDQTDLVRPTNAKELKATVVLRLPLVEVAAKRRSGGPIDDEADMGLPVWAGVIPLSLVRGVPLADGTSPENSSPPVAFTAPRA